MLIQSPSAGWQITAEGRAAQIHILCTDILGSLWLNWRTCPPPSEKFMRHRWYQQHPWYTSFGGVIVLQVRNPCTKHTGQFLSSGGNGLMSNVLLSICTLCPHYLEVTQTGHFVFKFSISNFVSYQNIKLNCLLPKTSGYFGVLPTALISILVLQGH